MIISYSEFCDFVTKHIQEGKDFYISLLENVIDNPSRYCGLFRLSNAKSKLIQNITQSREIKFGDIIEELTTYYISKLGYSNYNKNLGKDNNGDLLNVDQFFTDGNKLFLTEMKIRDDHDSTKKRGQYQNFRKKVSLVRERYPGKHLDASMWFVDDSLVKNKNYYLEEIQADLKKITNTSLHLYYGEEYFDSLKNGHEAWVELINILKEYRAKHATSNDVEIPDFGSSKEIYDALLMLPEKYWKKLMSNKTEYIRLREELFSFGNNLIRAYENRK